MPLHVLIIEDDEGQREPLVAIAQGLGCRVDVASDGASGFRLASENSPDVILMDISMPDMDGIQSTRRIRQLSSEKRPHIIVVSAMDDARTRQRAFEAGCDQYVVKPFDIERPLRAFVERHGHRSIVDPS